MANPNTKTKVVATLGPSCLDKKILKSLIETGVDVFRLNFSHGSHENHGNSVKLINQINKEIGSKTAILADLQGPKIRLGELQDGPFEVKTGDRIILTTKKIKGTKKKLYLSYESFAQDARIGETVKIDDGKIELKVVEIVNATDVMVEVVYGGLIQQKKGVNLPETKISIPSLTEKDIKDLEYILTLDISWIALSFVRTANDIIKLRGMIEFKGHPAKIVAKIEKPEALENLDAIIEASDAVMVARGDLGVEIPVENVPTAQKNIVKKCIEASKPVIIATQMMESMIEAPIPTRAEVTDVANAIYDGADAVMLSGETAVGKYPVKVVETMQRILERSELDDRIYNLPHKLDKTSSKFLSDAVCYNAISISEEVGAKAIICTTKSGYTAFTLASYRPKAKIYAFTENKELLNTLSLVWGVRVFLFTTYKNNNERVKGLQEMLVENGLLEKGDIVLNTGGVPIKSGNPTNFIRLSTIK